MQHELSHTVIEVADVSKTIKGRRVLENVSLRVSAGAICGISGPNGSGKSMLLRIICGLVIPNKGEVNVFGGENRAGKRVPPRHRGFNRNARLSVRL